MARIFRKARGKILLRENFHMVKLTVVDITSTLCVVSTTKGVAVFIKVSRWERAGCRTESNEKNFTCSPCASPYGRKSYAKTWAKCLPHNEHYMVRLTFLDDKLALCFASTARLYQRPRGLVVNSKVFLDSMETRHENLTCSLQVLPHRSPFRTENLA